MSEITVENGNGWTSKARALGIFINQVGIPAVIILSFLTYLGAVIFGSIESPVVTKEQFSAAMARNLEMHDAIIENARANTKAVEKIGRAIERIECDKKASLKDQIECLRLID